MYSSSRTNISLWHTNLALLTSINLNPIATQTSAGFGCRFVRPLQTLFPRSPLHVSKTASGAGRRSETPSRSSNMDNPPNTPIHTIVRAQIVFLLSTLTDENFERNQMEIRSVCAGFVSRSYRPLINRRLQLSEQHGIETYLHFIRRLILQSQPRLAPAAPPAAFDASTNLTFRLLVQETQRLARDPFLADRFRDGIDKGEGDTFRSFDLSRFMDRVGLRPLEKLVLSAPFMSTSLGRKELANQASTIIRHDFDNAVLALCHNPSFDHADLSPAQVSKLMCNLLSDPAIDSPVLDATQRQALIVAAQTKYGNETVAPILQRVLPSLR